MRLAAGLATALLSLPAHADTPRSIAKIVVDEGLAMHRDRALHPDAPLPDFAEAAARRSQILQDVRAVLSVSAERTSLDAGEIHYTAWQVTGFWLAHGETLAEIARVKQKDAPARVAEAIDLMLKEQR